MNQSFLAVVVKIPAAIFTIPMRFAVYFRCAEAAKVLMIQAFALPFDPCDSVSE
jgi:hypothetical protein